MLEGVATQRRRGAELETALLEAAWDELVEVGFAKLTMESIAARARTGVAVLYRRWPRKDDVVLAAIRYYGDTHPIEVPDTGSLREDLLLLLGGFSAQRLVLTSVMTATFAGLLAGSGLTPAQVRERIMAGRVLTSTEIFVRAQRRGEIDLDLVPQAVLDLPSDLMRHEVLMNLEAVPPARVREIVDGLFLPLVAHYQGRRAGAAPLEADGAGTPGPPHESSPPQPRQSQPRQSQSLQSQ
jgi:AcrR family transcriptional regulator